MAHVHPFKAILPRADIASLVPSRTYVSYSRQELINTLREDPYTFLHIINPDWEEKNRPKPHSEARLQQIRGRFEEFLEEGILVEDDKQYFYLYEQVDGDQHYLGIIGCISIDDRLNGTIRSHEETLTKRENLLKEYLKVCDINAEPVLLSYPDEKGLEDKMQVFLRSEPDHAFTTTDDNVSHRMWHIGDPEDIAFIREHFASIPNLYIADGHHRVASSVLLGQEKREALGQWTGKEGFNFFMAYFIPESRLSIFGYHRAIKDLNDLSPEAFLQALEKDFEVREEPGPVEPSQVHRFGLFLEGCWYSLTARPDSFDDNDPVRSLDSSILYHNILYPILGIRDPKASDRVQFAGGPNGMGNLMGLMKKRKMKAGFVLHPVTIQQLKDVSDTGKNMPPKTTWIEPKLRSGLTVYRMDLDQDV